jgi:catechol 2,3-dioxygenase-like lactoylglutathione lyase family enzyme
MFSHIMLGATDIEASKRFYDATLGALGYGPGVIDPKGRVFFTSRILAYLLYQRRLMDSLLLQEWGQHHRFFGA